MARINGVNLNVLNFSREIQLIYCFFVDVKLSYFILSVLFNRFNQIFSKNLEFVKPHGLHPLSKSQKRTIWKRDVVAIDYVVRAGQPLSLVPMTSFSEYNN